MSGLELTLIVMLVGTCLVIYVIHRHNRKRQRQEILEYVHSKRRKLSGKNRFLIDIEFLQQAFPDVPHTLIVEIWDELHRTGRIVQDQMDGEWVVK